MRCVRGGRHEFSGCPVPSVRPFSRVMRRSTGPDRPSGWSPKPSSRLSERTCGASTKPPKTTPRRRMPISSAFTGAVSGQNFTVDNAMLGKSMNEDLSTVPKVLPPDG